MSACWHENKPTDPAEGREGNFCRDFTCRDSSLPVKLAKDMERMFATVIMYDDYNAVVVYLQQL
eukprot:scaffold73662_cov21-Tisochrysis_lutea.AAC.2